jgi:hypothetical protein
MLKTIISQSKFGVDEKTALVYHPSEERITKDKTQKSKKRKLTREKIEELKKKKQHTETSHEEGTEHTNTSEEQPKEHQTSKQTNTKLLSFSLDEEEKEEGS